MDAPERWTEALNRAVADPLQLSVIRVHFQNVPRESEREESGDRCQKIPCIYLCMEPQAKSSLSLVPAHLYRHCAAFYHATAPHSCALFFFHPTDTEQVIALQPPCQPPMPNQLCLSRETTTEPTASGPSLQLLCLWSWTTSHHHWEVGTHQYSPSVKFSREGSGITPLILLKGRLKPHVRTQFLQSGGISGRRGHS